MLLLHLVDFSKPSKLDEERIQLIKDLSKREAIYERLASALGQSMVLSPKGDLLDI